MSPLPGFQTFEFTAEDTTRPIFHKGNGPAVVLMHELPGMIPGCVVLNPHDIRPKAHAVLTVDFVDQKSHPTRQALDRILETFCDRL